MKIINILIILIAGMIFACSDSVYEDFDNGMIIKSKVLRGSDATPTQPWLYEYVISDYSNTAGNTAGMPGDFYFYSSTNFAVGDFVFLATKTHEEENQKLIATNQKFTSLISSIKKHVSEDTEVQK